MKKIIILLLTIVSVIQLSHQLELEEKAQSELMASEQMFSTIGSTTEKASLEKKF